MAIIREHERFLDDHLKYHSNRSFFSFLSLGAIHAPYSPPDIFMDGTKVKGKYASNQLNMLYEMDLLVGRVVADLERRNLLHNTLVIFTSDNGGTKRNGMLKGSKGTIWEGGNTIPLIMQHRNAFPEGVNNTNLVGITDLYATLADFAGIKIPQGQGKDSISLLKSFKNSSELVRDDFFVFNYVRKKSHEVYFDMYGQQPIEQSIRTIRYKLIYYTPINLMILFDLLEDPSETKDICGSPKDVKLCYQLYWRMIRKGPCQERKGSWCPGNCRDDPTFYFKNFKTMTCKWISAKSKVSINTWCSYMATHSGYRPQRNPISNYCRETCGICNKPSRCINDRTWRSQANYNCDWVGRSPQSRCKLRGKDGTKAYSSCKQACQSYYKGICI
mmetsp:Transcript_15698/g.35350  ORF Transcript_15698/g.35350 Transcript_15698/m.35350 type:complete len:387 (-) Transcript_15698:54-1214(-)